MFFYHKDGAVKYTSEGQIASDLDYYEHTPSQDLQEKMDMKYQLKVNNGIEAIKTDRVTATELEDKKAALKAKAASGKLTMEDISTFIRDYL